MGDQWDKTQGTPEVPAEVDQVDEGWSNKRPFSTIEQEATAMSDDGSGSIVRQKHESEEEHVAEDDPEADEVDPAARRRIVTGLMAGEHSKWVEVPGQFFDDFYMTDMPGRVDTSELGEGGVQAVAVPARAYELFCTWFGSTGRRTETARKPDADEAVRAFVQQTLDMTLEIGTEVAVIPGRMWRDMLLGTRPAAIDRPNADDLAAGDAVPVPLDAWNAFAEAAGLTGEEPLLRPVVASRFDTPTLCLNPIRTVLHPLGTPLPDGHAYSAVVPQDAFGTTVLAAVGGERSLRLWVRTQASRFPLEGAGPDDVVPLDENFPAGVGARLLATTETIGSLVREDHPDENEDMPTVHLIVEQKTRDGWPSSLAAAAQRRGVVGLANLGNSCYMNSALQCLLHTEELAGYFLSRRYVDDINPDNPIGYGGHVAKSFAGLVEAVLLGANASFAPREFKHTVGRYNSAFAGYQQQDSQEFTAFLLDGLHEDLNRIKSKPATEKPELPDDKVNDDRAINELAAAVWDLHKKRNDSVVLDLFTGLYRSVLVCPVCAKVSVTFDPFMDLTLPLPTDDLWVKDVLVVLEGAQPFMFDVVLDRFATVRQLKEYVAAKLPEFGLDPSRFFSTEIFNNSFYLHHADTDLVADKIQTGDHVALFYLDAPADSPGRILVPVLSRYVPPSAEDEEDSGAARRHGPSGSAFGLPLMLSFSVEETQNADAIRKKVLDRFRAVYLNEDGPCDEASIEAITLNYARPRYLRQDPWTGTDASNLRTLPLTDRLPKPVEPVEPVESVDLVEEPAEAKPESEPLQESGAAGVGPDTPNTMDSSPVMVSHEDTRDDPREADVMSVSSKQSEPVSTAPDRPFVDRPAFDSDAPRDDSDSSPLAMGGTLLSDFNSPPAGDGPRSGSSDSSSLEEQRSPQLIMRGEVLVCDWPVQFEYERPKDVRNDDFERFKAEKKARHERGITLNDCLDLFSKPEVLGENDPWYCPRCRELRQATKTIELWHVPDIFAIHLKRFSSFRSFRDKIDDVVSFPIEGLDMSTWIGDKADNKTGDHVYDLFAVDNHFGGLGGGHYTATAKNFVDGKWYDFDDSSVRETQPERAITGSAYLLFYRRRSSEPLGGDYMRSVVEKARERLRDPRGRASDDPPDPVGMSSSSSDDGGQVLGASIASDTPVYQLPWASNPTELNLTPYSSDDETPNQVTEINVDHSNRMSDDEIDAI